MELGKMLYSNVNWGATRSFQPLVLWSHDLTMRCDWLRNRECLKFNPLRKIYHVWPVFTVSYISLNISRSRLLSFKNNTVFDISVKFAIEWWYSFWLLVQNSLWKALPKMTKISKKYIYWKPNRPQRVNWIPKFEKSIKNCENVKFSLIPCWKP